MKNFSKLIGLTLALSVLVVSGCKKKPVRDESSMLPPTGGPIGVDPNAVAFAADPASTLETRDNVAPVNPDSSVVEPIYFGLDRAAVAAAERPKLDAAIRWLGDNPEKSLVLVGHCDWRGTAEYNLGLGDRRANAVKAFLLSKGADPRRLETLSKGSTDAKQSGGDAEWQKDRRVDFVELRRQ
jgi:peptidoglycan-associated lipoprotein